MATTTTIWPIVSPLWGSSHFSNSSGFKVGRTSADVYYYGRIVFAAINPAWHITSIKLKMNRVDGYSTHYLKFGSTDDGDWADKAILDWSAIFQASSGTGTKTWDLTAYKEIIAAYPDAWYIMVGHGSGSNSYSEFTGGTGTSGPRLEITYDIATISVDTGSFTIGAESAITLGAAGNGFTHSLSYAIGELSGSIAENVAAGTIVEWTPPTALADEMPTVDSDEITMTLSCYTDGVLTATIEFAYTLNVPAEWVPTITSVVLAPINPIGDTIGIFVQNRSKISATITAAATSGSTLGTYKVSAGGAETTAAASAGDVVSTTSVLVASGTVSVKTTVTDARGRVAEHTQSITVYPYVTPSILSLTLRRCLVDGTVDNAGTYMKYSVLCRFSELNNLNTKQGSIKWAPLGDALGAPTIITMPPTGYTYEVTGVVGSGAIGAGAYSVQVQITDLYNTTVENGELASQQVWMSFYPDGSGMAFGGPADTAGIEDFKRPARFREGLSIDDLAAFVASLLTNGVWGEGNVEFEIGAGTGTTSGTEITFDRVFSGTPLLYTSVNSTGVYTNTISRSPTGCTLRTNTGTTTVAYLAIWVPGMA